MENYIKYYRKPRADNRGRLARFIDYYGFLFLLGLITTVLVMASTQNPVAGLAIAAILIFIEARVFRLVTDRQRKRARLHHRYFLAGENCMKAILELEHGTEFNTLVAKVLSGQEGFTNMRVLGTGNGGENSNDPGIDLEGLYLGDPVAVKCSFTKDPGKETGQAYIREFIGSLAEKDCKTGVFVTIGKFNHRAYDLAKSLRGKFDLHLIDGEGLMELARRAGVDIFPSEDKIDRLIREEKEKNSPGKGVGFRVFYNDSKKSVLYFTAAALLLVVVSLEKWSLFGYVYIAFALLNVVLGVMSIVFGRVDKDGLVDGFKPKP